jgi:DNA polymerase-3 subunit delta
MLQREHLDALRAALEAAHGEVETTLYDGRTAALADVLDELRSFSLMGRHKLVIVDEAEAFVTAHRGSLERYAQSPVDHATLVLRSPRWHPGNLDKQIAQVGGVVKCDPLPPAGAVTWLQRRATQAHNAQLPTPAATELVRRLGTDLSRLDSELAKLAALAGPGKPITTDVIDQLVARSSDEQAWAIQEAVLSLLHAQPRQRGLFKAPEASATPTARAVIDKIHELVDLSGQPDVLVAYFVIDLFRKLHLATMMKQQGASDSQIAERFRLFGPRRTAFLAAVSRLDERRAAEFFDSVVQFDLRAKTGRGDFVRGLECFCASLPERL